MVVFTQHYHNIHDKLSISSPIQTKILFIRTVLWLPKKKNCAKDNICPFTKKKKKLNI